MPELARCRTVYKEMSHALAATGRRRGRCSGTYAFEGDAAGVRGPEHQSIPLKMFSEYISDTSLSQNGLKAFSEVIHISVGWPFKLTLGTIETKASLDEPSKAVIRLVHRQSLVL